MIARQVWHKTFGVGSVIEKNDDYALINFDAFGEKKISISVWGTILFFSEEDFQNSDKEKIKANYSGYLPIPKPVKKREENYDGEKYIDDSKFKTVNQKMLMNSFDGTSKRNIVIILCQKTIRDNKSFLRIIGIDVFTGKVVNIVDTNGREYGLHSYHSEFAKLEEQIAIQADFKMIASSFHLNTLRIVSPFRILGKSNVRKLKEKYERLYSDIPDFIHEFKKVFEFCDSHKNSRSYFIVRFSNTKIQLHKDTYQLKMYKHFVNIRDAAFDYKQNEGKPYQGWVILQCDVNASGEYRFLARRLLGRFLTEQEAQKNGAANLGSTYEFTADKEGAFFVLQDEYDEYNNEILSEKEKELAGIYEEYDINTLDEYSEYTEDWNEEGDYNE